jgi:hypothetical protein
MPLAKSIYQLKITLKDTKPPIWRTIQVPSSYTFWELHCAIQNAFAWNNSHLHSFECEGESHSDMVNFGIPMEEDYDELVKTVPSWKYKINKYLHPLNPKMLYTYDFGDNWEHVIKLEEVLTAEKGLTYPRCIKGRRNSPPDDCGGVWGYDDMLEILADPEHEEFEDTKEWIESIKGGPFDPAQFDPKSVQFEDPKQVFELCFGNR